MAFSAVSLWASNPAPWAPAQQSNWQWQLTGAVDLSVEAEIYDLDLFTTDKTVIDALRAQGRRAICYFSAGSFEPYRPDAARFPAFVKGRAMDGWPDERWLDIRQLEVLGPIMEARLDLCKAKGFDAAEPDNVDGYQNRTGFTISGADQLRYNRFLAAAAHARGLSIGLKNDIDQIRDLVEEFDWALNEECFKYKECGAYKPFTDAGKAVFHVEYDMTPAQFCPQANALNFNSLHKRLSLDAYRVACRSVTSAAPTLNEVANAASYSAGGISPGEILVLFGSSMGGPLAQAPSTDLPVELGGTRVLFDDAPGGLIYVSERQVSAVAPSALRGRSSTSVKVQRGGALSEAKQVPVREAVPGIFTLDASGAGQAAAANQDGSINGAAAPAARGTVVLLYATGLGGGPVRVQVGGVTADVLYAGGVSWGVPGLVQLNVRVPSNAVTGSAVPVTLESGGVQAQNGVTLAIAP